MDCPVEGHAIGGLALRSTRGASRIPGHGGQHARAGGGAPSPWSARLKDTPSAALLFVQLGGLLAYPFMEDTRPGRAAFSLVGIAVLALAVLVVRRTPSVTWVSSLLAVP